MTRRLVLNTLATAFSTIVVFVAALPARADVNATQNIAFTANGLNPWGPGPAQEVFDSFTLLDIPHTHFDIGPLNGNPIDAALDALADWLGVPLPSLLKLQVGGSASGSAHLGVDYFASLGRLNVTYPARSTLNLQTISGGDYVRANQSYAIGSAFQPGVSDREIGDQQAIEIGGIGYSEPILGGLSFTSYNTPKFATKPPHAEAKLVLDANVQVGVYAQVKALGGLFKARKDFNFGGPVGGPLIEIDPSGLYVAGEKKLGVDLTAPYSFPIPFGTATVQLPRLGTSGAPIAPGSAVLHADSVTPVFTIDGDLEKIIPVIGPVLHNTLGPFKYDLLHVGGGPVISMYQDQTFTPDPQVRLTFSEPVMVDSQAISVADFPLGTPINWSPMFSNSSEITIVPQYILKNTFRNETGLDLSWQFNVDALSLTAPFIPGGPPDGHTIGPLIQTTENISLGRIPLPLINRDPWEISLREVNGAPITIPKSNLEIVPDLGDLKLTLAEFVGGTPDDPTYILHFDRSVVGGPPREYQATVSGIGSQSVIKRSDDSVLAVYQRFEASQDVVLTDPVTSEQYNLGRNFSLGGYDWSELLPAPSPAFLAEDPDNPGQFLPPLYVPTLPDIPNTDVDVVNHPILGQPDLTYVNGVATTVSGTEVSDPRNGPVLTILARTTDFNPEGDGIFDSFSPLPLVPLLNSSGEAIFVARSDSFVGSGSPRGFYQGDGATTGKLVREGDPAPGGSGTINLGEVNNYCANNIGQVAFTTVAGNRVLRAGPDGLIEIARPQQPAPDGDGTFLILYDAGAINDLGQVAFQALVDDQVNQTQEVAIYRGDGNTLTKIARQGDPVPGMTAPPTFFIDFALNDSGKVAFAAGNAAGESGVYIGDGAILVPIAVSGAVIPGGAIFQGFNSISMNAGGDVAFHAYVDPPGPDEFQLAVYKWTATGLTEIASNNGQLFGPSIYAPAINDLGQVAFGSTSGIYLHTEGTLSEIVLRSQLTPDGAGRFQSDGDFTEWQLNNEGQVAFAFDVLDIILLQYHKSIYVHDGTNLVEVARTGQNLAGSVVTQLTLGDLNDQMQIAYQVQLADGRQLIARFEPSIYWHNLGSGDWGTASNWSLGVEPTNPYDVFIVAEDALTVTGPAVDRTVKSLTIGGEDTANATLNLVSGVTLTATNGSTIFANGILDIPVGARLAGSLINNGTVNGPTTPGQFLDFDDPVSGVGVFNGNMRFNNVISPGSSPGMLNIDGDLALGTSAAYNVELSGVTIGSQYDSLNVTGEALLAGTLAVSLLDGYVPGLNDVFTVLTFASHSGDFANYSGLDVGGYLALQPTLTATSLILKARPAVDGDINLDGTVDIFDVNAVSANWATAGPQGDANGDGVVDIFDVNLISSNWGATGAGGGAAVPEPPAWSTAAIVAMAITSLVIRRRRST